MWRPVDGTGCAPRRLGSEGSQAGMAEAKRAELERLRQEVRKLEDELGERPPQPAAQQAEDDDDLDGVSRESTAALLPREELDLPTAVPRDSLRNALMVLLVSSVGNILEWFDFAVFGYFADTISVLFFPSTGVCVCVCVCVCVFDCLKHSLSV